ncbi:BAR adaptor protein Hob1 [Dipsacomyces acuminosporus]|nr:BAR adaptor protein Hob1 [Dipsacomyces acuminosporus]
MSWKGFKKALERMPHQLQNKIGRGAKTVDPEYDDLKLRFVDLEGVTKTLFTNAAEFRDSIHQALTYQIAVVEQILAAYRPITTDPEGVSQPTGIYVDEGASPELLRVAEEFRNRTNDIKAKIDPQLEALDASVVGPIQELLAMMKNIHRVIQKRDHKLIDYDRYKSAVEKYDTKEGMGSERSLPDEQAYQKYGAQYQEASRQYNYYNDMLKAELRQLLDLRQAFIDPIFLKFFHIQRQLYMDLFHEFSQAARTCPAFNLSSPVIVGWQQKWPRAEQSLASIDLWGQGFMAVDPYKFEDKNKGFVGSLKGTFRKKDKSATPPAAGVFNQGSPAAYGQSASPSLHSGTFTPPNGSSPYGGSPSTAPVGVVPGAVPGAAGAAGAGVAGVASAVGYSARHQQSPQVRQGQTYAPAFSQTYQPSTSSASSLPPPAYEAVAEQSPVVSDVKSHAPAPSASSRPQYVVAIYDYTAQADGDLTFKEGDRIELITRTEAKDDWWTGRLDGVTGVFPGTYVSDP